MTDFVNPATGRTVRLKAGGYVEIVDGITIDPSSAYDLMDFFTARNDVQKKRWRSPKAPGIVAYPRDPVDGVAHAVVLFNEHFPEISVVRRSTAAHEPGPHGEVARAYFEAHPLPAPTPKPWQDAMPGDVWMLEAWDGGPSRPFTVRRDHTFHNCDGFTYTVMSSRIKAGTPLWVNGKKAE